MHIFLAALAHETNSFSPIPTTLRSFEEGILYRPGCDDAVLKAALDFPGFGHVVETARAHGDDLTLGPCAWAQPGGPVARQVYEALRDALLDRLRECLQAAPAVDAVVLVLHGAMIAHGYPDCEGDLLARVRALAGPRVPVGALLDLHGNLTPAMIDSGAVLIACKEYPHTDYPARARELHAILTRMARGGCRPGVATRRVPMLGLFGTGDGPMRVFVDRVMALEAGPGLLSISLMHGFPWSDTDATAAAVMVYYDRDAGSDAGHDAGNHVRADGVAATLADEFFALRTLGAKTLLPVADAVSACLAPGAPGLRVLADGSDNPGGGAASDSTFVLRELLERGVRDAAVGMIWDPLAVRLATDAGVGAEIRLRIGGKVGPGSGDPLDVRATVTAVRDDACQHGLAGQLSEPLGDAVAIRVEGVDVVLNSIRQQVFSPECFTALGIDLATKRLVAVKSTRHFRARFDPIAVRTVFCDAPGALNSDLARLPYAQLRRPVWPLDPIDAPAMAPVGTAAERGDA